MLNDAIKKAIEDIAALPIPERVAALNEIRTALHAVSPFVDPVDLVLWVPAGQVVANNYNPNKVAAQEMKLLEDSIRADGYTQPIVAFQEPERYQVVDGFHRNRVGKEVVDIAAGLHGYLPVTLIRSDLANRMASTIRHNRARGKHQVDGMADVISELVQKGWNDEQIAQHLGMSAEELLRLKQNRGVAAAMANRHYARAWEAIPEGEDEVHHQGDEQTG